MREIKFRAWDNKYDRFFNPIHTAYKGDLEDLMVGMNGDLLLHTIDFVEHESCFPGRFILEQYTGLKDKNGKGKNSKEIYEGDIIRYIVIDKYGDTRTERVVIEVIQPLNVYIETLTWIPRHGEVIGNIHENPDLLEVDHVQDVQG